MDMLWTHHERVGGTHAVEAVVEGSKLFIDGLIQQEVDVELDILCGKKQACVIFIIPLQSLTLQSWLL